jgi:E3 ubiquitin-protein ligase DOA10
MIKHLPFRDLGRRIEGDPVLQYKIHKFMARVWLTITLPLLAFAIFFPHVWLVVGIAYVMVASNYANWATDSGAMSAANASTDESITPFAKAEDKEDAEHSGE